MRVDGDITDHIVIYHILVLDLEKYLAGDTLEDERKALVPNWVLSSFLLDISLRADIPNFALEEGIHLSHCFGIQCQVGFLRHHRIACSVIVQIDQ